VRARGEKEVLVPQEKISRPNWDDFFMSLVREAAKRSACIYHPTASFYVDKHHHIMAFGYSGPSHGDFNCSEEGVCLKIDGDPLTKKIRRCNGAHAEINAIVNSGNTERLRGATLYTTIFPCYDCMKILNNVGVERIVYNKFYERLIDGGQRATEGVESEALELAHKRGIILERYLFSEEKKEISINVNPEDNNHDLQKIIDEKEKEDNGVKSELQNQRF